MTIFCIGTLKLSASLSNPGSSSLILVFAKVRAKGFLELEMSQFAGLDESRSEEVMIQLKDVEEPVVDSL
jgi:hypothetical protein